MTSLLPLTQDLIRAFGWTLLHSFWQAFCIFACLRIVLKIWPQASAAIKYHLSYLSLAGITGWFAVTFFNQLSVIRETQEVSALVGQLDAVALEAALRQVPPPATSGLQTMLPGMEAYFPFIVAVYMAGVLFMTVKLSIDLTQLRQMRRQGVSSPGLQWDRYIKALGLRMGITRRVQLFISQHLQVPVMIGFIRPVILLPAAMVNNLSPEQLEAILLHELAHIKRNDYLLNIFQSIVETVLFFNPFVWWISKNIRLEREHCCDDLVIAGTVQPLHYAKALVALEEYRLTVNPMAMAAADDKHHLFQRIKRIMEMKTKNLNYSQRLLALLIIVTGLVSIAWLTPGQKHEKNEPCNEMHATACDTIPAPPAPPAAPSAIAAVSPNPASVPAAPAPLPSAGVVPAIAPQPAPPLPPMAPLPPQPGMMPTPPPPPLPRLLPAYADTTHPRKIVVKDDKGTRIYKSLDEMPAEDREKYERAQAKYRVLRQNRQMLAEQMVVAQDAVKNIDWSKMNAQIQEAMKKVDWSKIDATMQESMKRMNKEMAAKMKETDWEKVGAEINENLKNIQWEKISEQIKTDLKKTDWNKLEKEIKEKIEKIDWKQIEEDIKNNPGAYHNGREQDRAMALARERSARHRELAERQSREARDRAEMDVARSRQQADRTAQRAREQAERDGERARRQAEQQSQLALARAEKDLQRTRENGERQARLAQQQAERNARLADEHQALARRHQEEAGKTQALYNELLDKMESDKLINRNSNFEIDKKGDELYINGKKQSDDVKKKYEQYLKNENVSIKGNKNDLNIHARDNR